MRPTVACRLDAQAAALPPGNVDLPGVMPGANPSVAGLPAATPQVPAAMLPSVTRYVLLRIMLMLSQCSKNPWGCSESLKCAWHLAPLFCLSVRPTMPSLVPDVDGVHTQWCPKTCYPSSCLLILSHIIMRLVAQVSAFN